jgi:hypothetical protein
MKSTRLILTATVIALSSFIFGPEPKADIIILQSGDIVPGKIIGSNRDGLDIVQSGSTNKEHWSVKMINKVWLEKDVPKSDRIPSWVKILSQLTTNRWTHNFKQIPATVIDNGVLKDVPYISFRFNLGEYELNIYGDLERPACIEIGTVGLLVNNKEAMTNCVNFMASTLTRPRDKAVFKLLTLTTNDLLRKDGLTFKTILPDEPDCYGGWWVSIYDDKALGSARASAEELARITQPKQMPKVVIPTAAQVPTYYWSESDISINSRHSASDSCHGGAVYVNDYYRANGTYFDEHTRRSSASSVSLMARAGETGP